MKKILLFTALFSFTLVGYSQANPILKSKKGTYILPQTGDWGIGASVNPFFSYLGNMFTSNNVVPGLDFQNINFKYFKDEKNVRRAGITIQSHFHTEKIQVNNLDPDAEPGSTVYDKISQSELNINLTYGLEKRRGSGRLQGVYGIEGLVGYGTGSKTRTKYGNSMEFYANAIGPNRPTLNSSTPSALTLGAQAFLGFEYFFAPKISVGGEVYLNASYTFGGKAINKSEVWDSNEGKSNIVMSSLNNRTGDFNFGIRNWSNLRFMFYF
ncbi:MAG: hypothetical protein M0R38_07605 [Bacteroidia bacterium]|nr:hypothetical protein [Bacteroidia bacterium]